MLVRPALRVGVGAWHSPRMLDKSRDGDVVTLTINRPQRRNALHGPLWTALREEAESLTADPPRAVILTGTAGHFSAGMDLKMDNPLVQRLAPAVMNGDREEARALILELKRAVDAINDIPAPVVAAIEGACTGGGLEVALACDLRIAGRGAFFSMPETHVGMVPDVGGTVRLSRIVGRTRATDLILTGRRVSAATAEAWGLLNQVVEDGQTLEKARALTAQLRRAAPGCTRSILRVLRNAPVATFEEETNAGIDALMCGEAIEGAMAFVEKRPPSWAS